MNRQKILLVEDEIGIAEMFRGFLEDAYDVSVFTNPSEALSELSGTGKTYDIIITDLKMPGVSGMEILDKAKQADRYTEVIIITGYGTLESASEAVNRGAMSYLLKPVSVPDFLTQVEKASSRREFNRKSAELIESIPEENTGLREHAVIFRNLHDFSTELTKTLEYEELVKLVLREFCTRTGTDTAYLITDHGLELKLYLYGVSSEAGEETLYNAADKASGIWNRYNEDAAADPLTISRIVLSPSSGGCPSPVFEKTISVPLIFMGRILGIIFFSLPEEKAPGETVMMYLSLISNHVSAILDNAYIHLKTKRLADTDGLTNIHNHRAFQEILSKEINRHNHTKSKLALVIADIDDFKKVNDTYGHLTGDSVLRSVSSIMKDSIRSMDTLARYGGEEFGIIVPETEPEGVKLVAERIRSRIESFPFTSEDGIQIKITMTMGVAFSHGSREVQKAEMIEKADKALYKGKNEGKNRVVFSPGENMESQTE